MVVIMPDTKYCKRCEAEKEISQFYKHNKTGLRFYCIECTKKLAKQDALKYRYTDKYKEKIKRTQEKRIQNKEKALLTSVKQRSKRKNINFTICVEDIVIPEYCPILGIPIKHNTTGLQPDSPSIDRIDNSKGYTKDNIRVISNRANILKKDITIEELEKIIAFYDNIRGDSDGH